jgi:hypothetical protein
MVLWCIFAFVLKKFKKLRWCALLVSAMKNVHNENILKNINIMKSAWFLYEHHVIVRVGEACAKPHAPQAPRMLDDRYHF